MKRRENDKRILALYVESKFAPRLYIVLTQQHFFLVKDMMAVLVQYVLAVLASCL